MSNVSKPRLLLIDDDPSIGRVFATELRRMGYDVEVVADLEPAREAVLRHPPDLALLDIRLPGGSGRDLLVDLHRSNPDLPIIMLTGYAELEVAIECMREGAYDFLTKPCPLNQLQLTLKRALEYRDLRQRNRTLAQGFSPMRSPGLLIGSSAAMTRLRGLIARIAPTDETVLITGESGTGKELVAYAIWQQSLRAGGPYIAENCCAVNESLLESELFGHEKGAFTGAESRRSGLFELAHHGTLLLDEIGDMPMAMQAKLLRVLQSGEVRRVGGGATIQLDLRVIAATNKDLQEGIQEGTFREDLYHRISTLQIRVPPLRERTEDIPLLAEHILAEYSRSMEKSALSLDSAALSSLMTHDWPGNIRELQNVLKRAAVMTDGDVIHLDDLPLHITRGEAHETPTDLFTSPLADVEKQHILRVLNHVGGNKTQAARVLGITKRTLYNKLAIFNLSDDAPEP